MIRYYRIEYDIYILCESGRMSSDRVKKIRTVQSVDRVIAIMTALADRPQGLSLSELAAHLKLAPQTVQSLVRTLQFHGIIFQAAPGKAYQTGPGVLKLAGRWLESSAIFSLAGEAVARLADDTGEYVTLAELKGGELIHHFEARPGMGVSGPLSVGSERLHVMATGKLLLAALSVGQRDTLIGRLELKKFGPRSVTDKAKLRAALDRITKDGYAVTLEENGPYLGALAVPVRDAAGTIRAALGIAVSLERFGPVEQKKYLKQLSATAAGIEARWGK